ncbi:putative RDD family membrane protein YckC [Actinorugispora endophytica]|uniref:Putative RDD family membrane protein YckC n=2 Tax=Actinorugispora endophytica TaxID=1605990 RepID=A0A4R6VCX6_9ACTN|nr:putative RDD family membrane protein YckC [Actinorugispora endophytica]
MPQGPPPVGPGGPYGAQRFPGSDVDPGTGLPLAGFGRRLSARLIDYTFLVSLLFVFFVVVTVFQTMTNPDLEEMPDAVAEVWAYLFLFGWGLAQFLYDWLFLAASGRTPGKRLVSIKVVGTDGGLLSQGRSAARSALFGLPHSVLCLGHLFLVIDCLWPAADTPRRQAVHDKAVRSMVIRG